MLNELGFIINKLSLYQIYQIKIGKYKCVKFNKYVF